jgi:hippurate hydrolase
MLSLAADELARLTTLRRDLHAHPELGFEETRTAAIVAAELEAAGITVTTGLGQTGVVGTLTVGNGTRRILLRADMDALAMPETTPRPYASTVAGKMHACGHDGHTTLLLGAARHLAATRNFSGTVHFVFQPAEEGRGGAKAMIRDGFFTRFPVDAAYGLHNMPGLAPDQIAVITGPQCASSDSWIATFTGVGTHGAKPHLGRDAVTAAAQFVTTLQSVVGRVVDPLEPSVVSACAFSAGDMKALNVIPETVTVGGTARSYSAVVRDQLEAEIGRLAQGIAHAFGVKADFQFRRGIPPVINHPDAAAKAVNAAIAAVGADRVLTRFPPTMAGDDFAEFAADIPGCYVWLGNGPAVDGALHHNSGYDFSDAALPAGISFWVKLVEEELRA